VNSAREFKHKSRNYSSLCNDCVPYSSDFHPPRLKRDETEREGGVSFNDAVSYKDSVNSMTDE